MPNQNTSRKSGTNTKTSAKTKTPSKKPTTGSKSGTGNKKVSKTTQKAYQGKIIRQSFQAQDIKSLVKNQGRAKVGGQEWALKAPSWNDVALQSIISDPKFTVKASSKPCTDGKLTLELRGNGKTLNVTVGC
ncbi:MAG: hypothetical protein FJX03_04780 [Alphaproteobacteria bacterium]|jgi:hypothetical protein|nr:hypothetical protein [Alphaproteobacteria bacterium]